MGIITKEVEVRPHGNTIKHFKEKGYDVKYHEPLVVKVEDLPKGSTTKVQIACDYCGKILERTYARYNELTQDDGLYACKSCVSHKMAATNLKKYGVEFYTQSEEFKEKAKRTNLERYGFESYSQSEDGKEKRRNTLRERYGVDNPCQNQEILRKARETCVEKYGTPYPIQLQEFKDKVKQTCIEKFGVEHISQAQEIREKVSNTFYKNGTANTSKQQIYLHNIYGGKLNFPLGKLNIDICFPEEKIAIEYNGGGHNLQVKTGKITQEEFERREIIRNSILKKEGYKTITIISDKDKLPSDKILFQMLQEANEYFSKYLNHSWYEYNISTSSVRNAECKEGIPYDFGSLRTIKDSDLNNDLSTTNNTAQAV